MANQDHLHILKQGVASWNRWRQDNPEVGPDLSEADLRGTMLRDARLDRVNLSWAKVRGADLSRADLTGANLSGTDLNRSILSQANLSQTTLHWAKCRSADFNGANFSQAKFSGIDLSRADCSHANLVGANLNEENLSGANLSGAILTGANLSQANLAHANLYGTNLSGADLKGADLHGANLVLVDFSQADLSGASFIGATLNGALLQGANFSKAVVGSTTFANLDLRAVRGLHLIEHWRPSTVGLDTIYRSESKIPANFLRGVGVPETLITYVDSLTAEAIHYYSCFISYSAQDQAFADRLYNDLQRNGVRCWYAPENMKIGDKIRLRVDESIRLHDKLLLILSGHSVSSQWVQHEVEHALDLEMERGELILFPIRLDDAVLESQVDWTANIRQNRYIGDFRRWQDPDLYRHAFQRLLRDLKSMESLSAPPYLTTASTEARRQASLRLQLTQHQNNLNKLREQAALYAAGEIPLRLLNQMEAEERRLVDLKAEMDKFSLE